ncbi:hypothetical protein HOF92_13670 [bacterium]|jgi:plastocyanin|nr:hypothetical protein [bacterium]
MRIILLSLLALVSIQTLQAAALRGQVTLRKKGNHPAPNPYVNDTFRTDLRFTTWHLRRKFETTRLKNYDDPTETIVYLSKIPARYERKEVPPQEPIKVYIEGAHFKPRTLPVLTGSTVEFVNLDSVFHDVYSYSLASPFQTPFFHKKTAFITMKKPGGVSTKSSIYQGMRGEILVLDNPYFTKPRNDGYYSMRNLRPGVYHVTAWHPEFPPITKEVEVNYGETITIDFNLTTMGLPEALVRSGVNQWNG